MAFSQGSELHQKAIIIDGLNISAWDRQVFTTMRRGGVTAINATVACWESFRQTMENIAAWHRRFEELSDVVIPVREVKDVLDAKTSGRVGVILGFQNLSPIEDDLDFLSLFHVLDVRIMQLAFHARNLVGDSSSEAHDCGLSRFGRDVIQEMNRLGILIDLSHTSDRTTREAIDLSVQPVAISHANPRSLCNHPRNKPDDLIIALSRKGGVIGANIFPLFMPNGWKATLSDFFDVIDYLVNLVGVDHVGIGTDFTENRGKEWFHWLVTNKNPYREPILPIRWPYIYPEGFRSAADFPNVTTGLLGRGYSESEVLKIIGENWMRLFAQVWKSSGRRKDVGLNR